MCSSANDREAGNDPPRENFRGVMSKFASRTRNLKREMSQRSLSGALICTGGTTSNNSELP